MSQYTTGELAKLCGVSVRTVQYYDTRGILIPSALSEGGRRLYSEADLERMRIICFLREVGLSINNISSLLKDDAPGNVIAILLDEQEQLLRSELKERQTRLELVEHAKRTLRSIPEFSVESIGTIAHITGSRKKLTRIRIISVVLAFISELIESGTLLYGILSGIWWPYLIGIPVAVGICIGIVAYYFNRVEYICPACHTMFKPRFWEAFWARHTPSTRKLTCVNCGHRGFCVETYRKEAPLDE